jgi:hypothetical protein
MDIKLALDSPFSIDLLKAVGKWRDKAQGTLDKVGRRVCCRVAIAALSIAGLVESVTSLALAILTSPSLLAGSKVSVRLLNRAAMAVAGSLIWISIGEFVNVFNDRI